MNRPVPQRRDGRAGTEASSGALATSHRREASKMNRKLKALGLALFAAFALSAMTASGASAAEEFHSSEAHTILDVTQDGTEGSITGQQIFETTVGKLSCTGVEASVTLTAKTLSEITAVPTYTKCNKIENGAEGLVTHVKFTSCDYLFTSKKSGTHSQVHIQCSTPGDHIHVNATFLGSEILCMTIPPQTPTSGGVVYHNLGEPPATRTITIEVTVEGIEYTEKGACGSSTVNNGKYFGNVLVQGTNTNNEETDIWWG